MKPSVETIWNEFAATLGPFIAARVADPATAEDILQDVFRRSQRRWVAAGGAVTGTLPGRLPRPWHVPGHLITPTTPIALNPVQRAMGG